MQLLLSYGANIDYVSKVCVRSGGVSFSLPKCRFSEQLCAWDLPHQTFCFPSHIPKDGCTALVVAVQGGNAQLVRSVSYSVRSVVRVKQDYLQTLLRMLFFILSGSVVCPQ